MGVEEIILFWRYCIPSSLACLVPVSSKSWKPCNSLPGNLHYSTFLVLFPGLPFCLCTQDVAPARLAYVSEQIEPKQN